MVGEKTELIQGDHLAGAWILSQGAEGPQTGRKGIKSTASYVGDIEIISCFFLKTLKNK